jgi:DNA-binding transcriptional LysR family regulator
MTITTDMLAAFVKVAETLSVSAAAIELGVGKSVVSKRIAQLEGAVKATLFSRSTRRVALTPAGEAYLGFARRALVEVTTAEERLRDLRAELTGQIRLTAPVSWAQRVLARRLPEFLRQHPAIEIELQLADRVVDIAYERFDLALRWTPLPAPELSAVPIARVEWVLAADPSYLARAGAPAEPRDLAAHPCLGYWRESSDEAWTLALGPRRERVQVRGRYHVNNPEAVVEAALAGLGIALLPGYLCDDALADGRLVRVLPAWTPETKFGTRIVALATPERMRLTRNQALVAFLRQQFAA